ncbi:MAG TPA: VWA domain-containing protein [Pyrinomonadaceae bacterium]|jgi:VWFA-related protein|nr:VWA domain-containing protein [Pyrinomonadaceae bacterium]
MKKFFVFLSLASLLLTNMVVGFSQVRPRRVGQSSSAPQTTAPAPSRPPVLGGANNPNNRRPETQQDAGPAGPEEVDAGDIIRVSTTLVTIPVSVMDRDGRYVPNLQKEEFRIWEDGVEQEVAFFQSVDKPFSVVLMLDTSPSTQFRLEDIQDAAISFVNQLRNDDKVMVVSFNDDIKILSDFTTDRNKLHRAIQRSKTDDGTRLYDAVDMVINQQLSRVQGRKAIVLFTDGVDTTSRRASYESNIMDAQELDALIYPVQYDTSGDMNVIVNQPAPVDIFGQILGGIFGGGRRRGGRRGGGGGGGGGGYPPNGPTMRGDYDIANHYLMELANSTGGREYHADSLQNMTYAFANVAEELRRQYSIGYYPKRPPQAGQRRQIRVRARQPNLAVRARDSYIFNPSGTAVISDNSTRSNAPVLKKLSEDF